ncbi:MAG: AAA family ATPase, partial [Acidobacteriia bacterium]|nr:AAA family ATPase [Terriglobia bacterium]
MILRCLEVQGWRCFAGRVRLGEFSERLNVVHGPNGAGKSTLFQAMARGLLDSHRVGGEEAETLRPWGRELAPVAAVEFRHGGQEYRLTKRFLDRPSAELERREHGAWARAFESDAADNEVRRMLRASAPGRGLAQIRNWGLAQALWTPQGDLSLGELSGDLAADIRSMLGAQFAGPGGGRVEQRIEALYGQYFGKKTGAVKRGQHAPEAVRLGEKLKAAQAALADASRRLLEFEERSRRLEDIRAGKAQFRRDIDALQAALAAARRRAQEYAGLSLERERRAGQARAAEAEYQQLAQRIEAIQAAAADLSRTAAEGEKLGTALPDLVRAAAERRREAEQKRAALEDVRGTRAAVDAARNAAAQAAGYGAAGRQGAAASLRLEEVGGLEAAVAGIRAERAQLAAPSDTALRSIRKAAKERDDAQTRLESALIQVEVVPARAVDVTVLEGEQRGPRALEAGRPARFQGSPEIVLEIAGFGRVRAGGPASNAAEIRAERDKAAGRLARLTEPFGTADLDTLEALA